MVLQMYGLPVGFYFGVNVNLFELKGKIQKDFVESLPQQIDSLAFVQTEDWSLRDGESAACLVDPEPDRIHKYR